MLTSNFINKKAPRYWYNYKPNNDIDFFVAKTCESREKDQEIVGQIEDVFYLKKISSIKEVLIIFKL